MSGRLQSHAVLGALNMKVMVPSHTQSGMLPIKFLECLFGGLMLLLLVVDVAVGVVFRSLQFTSKGVGYIC